MRARQKGEHASRRQRRIVSSYLTIYMNRAVPRDELAEVLCGDELPATWEKRAEESDGARAVPRERLARA